MGVNPEDKSGVEPLRRLVVNYDFLPAAPAAKLVPNVSLCVPLDHTSKADRGILTTGHPKISIYPCPGFAPWRGHFSVAACSARNNTGDSSYEL